MSSIYQSLTRQFRSLQGARVMTTALSVVAMLLGLNGCASYTTPGAGVQLTQLADADINELMAKQPAAKFPARIAFTRLQASGYSAYGTESYGNGAFSVVTAREMESETDFMKTRPNGGRGRGCATQPNVTACTIVVDQRLTDSPRPVYKPICCWCIPLTLAFMWAPSISRRSMRLPWVF